MTVGNYVRNLSGRACGAVDWGFQQAAPPSGKAQASTPVLGEARAGGPAPGKTKTPKQKLRGLAGGSDRRRSGDLSIFSRTLYQLSYRAKT